MRLILTDLFYISSLVNFLSLNTKANEQKPKIAEINTIFPMLNNPVPIAIEETNEPTAIPKFENTGLNVDDKSRAPGNSSFAKSRKSTVTLAP